MIPVDQRINYFLFLVDDIDSFCWMDEAEEIKRLWLESENNPIKIENLYSLAPNEIKDELIKRKIYENN